MINIIINMALFVAFIWIVIVAGSAMYEQIKKRL